MASSRSSSGQRRVKKAGEVLRGALGRVLVVALAGAVFAACGEAESPSEPSPQAVATAEAISRDVRIPAAFSTTPTPEDEERETEIVLDGRVFGDGPTGVILAHMRPADQTSWFPLATELAATGDYTVLTFNFRGYEPSTGEKEFNRVDTDLQAALDYMRDELGKRDVLFVGASMGGTAALIVAARDDIGAVVSLSSLAFFQEMDALGTITDVDAAMLFIASEDDIPAMRSLEQFMLQANQPKTQIVHPGKAHGTDLFAEPFADELRSEIVEFLAEHTP